MKLSPHVDALLSDLEAVAAAGDERTAEVADRLGAALRASAGLRLLDALSEAVLELNAQLPSGRVEVRLDGRDPSLVFVADETEEPEVAATPAGEAARITLRLADALKTEAEAAAAREGLSVNAWLVRSIARAISSPGHKPKPGRGRLTGYGRS
jgi:hypothetical protein